MKWTKPKTQYHKAKPGTVSPDIIRDANLTRVAFPKNKDEPTKLICRPMAKGNLSDGAFWSEGGSQEDQYILLRIRPAGIEKVSTGRYRDELISDFDPEAEIVPDKKVSQ